MNYSDAPSGLVDSSRHLSRTAHLAAGLRSATAVKVGQERFSALTDFEKRRKKIFFLALTVDFRQNIILTFDLIPFIFAIFSCTI